MDVTVDVVTPQIDVDVVSTSTVVSATLVNLNTPVPGKSTYQIAVDNGFVGTEAEWLESLAGGGAVLNSYAQVSQLPDYPNSFTPAEHDHDGVYVKPADLPDVSNFITAADLPDVSEFLTSSDLPDLSGFLTDEDLPNLEGYATTDQLAGKADTGHRHDYNEIDNTPEVGIPEQISLVASTDQITSITIQDDGTPTDSWPNRWEGWFAPVAGAPKLVMWYNEYYEQRITPAKNSTVAQRIFVAENADAYAQRSPNSPVWQIVDYRSGPNSRTPLVQVSKEGMDVKTQLNVDLPIKHQGHSMSYVTVIDHDYDESQLPEGTVFFRRPAP